MRKHNRASINCEISYPSIVNGNERKTFFEGVTLTAVDLSETGIGLKSNFMVPQDSFLSFYLRLNDNIPFRTLIKLRWQQNKDGCYYSGGEFIALNLQEIYQLRSYVNSHINIE